MVRYALRSAEGAWSRGDTLLVTAAKGNRHGYPLQVNAYIDGTGARHAIVSTVENDQVQSSPVYEATEAQS